MTRMWLIRSSLPKQGLSPTWNAMTNRSSRKQIIHENVCTHKISAIKPSDAFALPECTTRWFMHVNRIAPTCASMVTRRSPSYSWEWARRRTGWLRMGYPSGTPNMSRNIWTCLSWKSGKRFSRAFCRMCSLISRNGTRHLKFKRFHHSFPFNLWTTDNS